MAFFLHLNGHAPDIKNRDVHGVCGAEIVTIKQLQLFLKDKGYQNSCCNQ